MGYTAIVPARSGSKRLPNKNIKMLSGKPLMVWTLLACVDSDKVDEVIFSTDSMDYWDLAKKYIDSEKLTLDYRTSEEAGDTVKIFDYLKNDKFKIFGDRKGCFLLALPTAPLRNSKHISEAIALYEETNKAVFSATEYSFSIQFAFNIIHNEWSPIFPNSPMITGNTRSQDQEQVFHPNGAIYIRSLEDLNESSLATLYKDAVPYIMSKVESIDIDEETDFLIAQAILNK
jgi:N-acylneuraminate cytidylyltransferase/CMP-N,N'-diacetyllegionaminic acid synthase